MPEFECKTFAVLKCEYTNKANYWESMHKMVGFVFWQQGKYALSVALFKPKHRRAAVSCPKRPLELDNVFLTQVFHSNKLSLLWTIVIFSFHLRPVWSAVTRLMPQAFVLPPLNDLKFPSTLFNI